MEPFKNPVIRGLGFIQPEDGFLDAFVHFHRAGGPVPIPNKPGESIELRVTVTRIANRNLEKLAREFVSKVDWDSVQV